MLANLALTQLIAWVLPRLLIARWPKWWAVAALLAIMLPLLGFVSVTLFVFAIQLDPSMTLEARKRLLGVPLMVSWITAIWTSISTKRKATRRYALPTPAPKNYAVDPLQRGQRSS